MDAGGGLLTAADLTGYEVVEREPLVGAVARAPPAHQPAAGVRR